MTLPPIVSRLKIDSRPKYECPGCLPIQTVPETVTVNDIHELALAFLWTGNFDQDFVDRVWLQNFIFAKYCRRVFKGLVQTDTISDERIEKGAFCKER